MSSAPPVVRAIRKLSSQLGELSMPDSTEIITSLVVQQQQLLKAYLRSIPPDKVDRDLLVEISEDYEALKARTQIAHGEAALELESVTLGRNARSAYGE